jgi:hypothetical protein
MKTLLLLLITAVTLWAELASTEFAKLLELASCESGVNYQILRSSETLSKVEKEFLATSKDELNSMSEPEQIAWYSNLYNFYTIKLIVDNYPTKSIRDLKSPWDSKIVPLWGKQVSLNHIEHEILRKKFNEPRIHFALNCASIGCPPLRATPFSGAGLESQLDEQALSFLSDKNRNSFDGKTLSVSQIFQWYGGDFKKNYGSYEEYIKSVLKISGKVKVKFLKYDWNLNSSTCN